MVKWLGNPKPTVGEKLNFYIFRRYLYRVVCSSRPSFISNIHLTSF